MLTQGLANKDAAINSDISVFGSQQQKKTAFDGLDQQASIAKRALWYVRLDLASENKNRSPQSKPDAKSKPTIETRPKIEAHNRNQTQNRNQNEMLCYARSVASAILHRWTMSPIAATALLALFAYFALRVTKFAIQRTVGYRKFCQIPGLKPATWIGWLVLGDIEIYYKYMWHLRPENTIQRLFGAFYSVDCFKRHGLGRFTIGPLRFVVLFQARTVETMVTSMEHIEKANEYRFFGPWLGAGLLTSTGDKWRRHRKLLTPAFHFNILDSFLPVMNENACEMIRRLERITRSQKSLSRETREGEIDIRDLVADCALDTICETAMGVRVGAQAEHTDVDYVRPLNEALKQVIRRIMDPLFQFDFIYNISPSGRQNVRNLGAIHRFVRKVIEQRRAEMEAAIRERRIDIDNTDALGLFGKKKRYAFLDSLLVAHFRQPEQFTMKDILDEVNTFMFEGHDTTSMGLIFALMLIASDRRVQDKIFDELESIFGDDDPHRAISNEDCREMRYLEMVIKESLRLYPPVPFVGRKIHADFRVGDYVLPAGSTCAIIIYYLHRDAKVFPRPEKFIPERFEPDSPVHRMPYAYMPFSAGPRNCIGQKFAMLEMKIMLASIIRRYRLTAITKRDEISIDFSIIIKTETPVVVKFEPR